MQINQTLNIRSNWVRLLLFFFLWLLSSAIFYAFLVLPIYPESLYFSSIEFDRNFNNDYLLLLLIQIASLFGTIFSFWYMKRKIENGLFDIVQKFNFEQLGKGCVIGLIIIIIWLSIMIASGLISFNFSTTDKLPVSILLFLIVAITEEVFFRGYVLTNLLESMSYRLAIVCSSFIFALVHVSNAHFGWIGFINIFLFGILTALFYLENNNLSIAIGIHFIWNLAQNLFGFAVSGHKLAGLFSLRYHSLNVNLTGGKFGIEGSLLLTPIILVAIFVNLNKSSVQKMINNQ